MDIYGLQPAVVGGHTLDSEVLFRGKDDARQEQDTSAGSLVNVFYNSSRESLSHARFPTHDENWSFSGYSNKNCSVIVERRGATSGIRYVLSGGIDTTQIMTLA